MTIKANAFFVDCGLTYSGVATTTLSGLGHLEKETVAVLGNGAYLGTFTVTNGTITGLPSAVTKAQIGTAYTSVVKPTKLDIEGTGLSVKKRITKAIISFYQTLGGEFGVSETETDVITFRTCADEMDDSPDLFTGIKEVSFPGGYERSGDIIIKQEQPLPMIIRGLILKLDAYQD